jgi:hypothetical protein
MSRRNPLPPPVPPEEIRTWPDRDTLLRDRAVILGELVTMYIGPGRLGKLWMWAGTVAFGWSWVGAALVVLDEAVDAVSVLIAVLCIAVGACLMIPAGVFVALGATRDEQVRRLLEDWGGLDRDPVGDPALRRPGPSLAWALLSYVLCAGGLFVCVVVPATARAGHETYGLVAWLMGLGIIAWVTGLLGLRRAYAHRRWVLRTQAPAGQAVRG